MLDKIGIIMSFKNDVDVCQSHILLIVINGEVECAHYCMRILHTYVT